MQPSENDYGDYGKLCQNSVSCGHSTIKRLLMVLCFVSFFIIILKEGIISEAIWKKVWLKVYLYNIFPNKNPFWLGGNLFWFGCFIYLFYNQGLFVQSFPITLNSDIWVVWKMKAGRSSWRKRNLHRSLDTKLQLL